MNKAMQGIIDAVNNNEQIDYADALTLVNAIRLIMFGIKLVVFVLAVGVLVMLWLLNVVR